MNRGFLSELRRIAMMAVAVTTLAPAIWAACPDFAPAINYGAGTGANAVATSDFNGDGTPDLAVANQGANNVSVLLGSGTGTFAAAIHYSTGTAPYSVAIGDFDRNGTPDLAVANNGSNNVSILLGNGNGTFVAGVPYGAGTAP